MLKVRIKGIVSIDFVSTKINSQIQLWSVTFFNVTGYFPIPREKVEIFWVEILQILWSNKIFND